MKRFNKRFNILIAFALGAILFTGAAFAEIKTLTGYEELKNAVKHTVPFVDYDSYTAESTITLKDNDKLLVNITNTTKEDILNGISMNKSTNFEFGELEEYYHYDDKKQSIHYNYLEDIWYVYKKNGDYYPDIRYVGPDFNDPTVVALEKVIDAGVAAFNLQNSITAEKDSDGNTLLTIDLGQGQIHPFINAVFSFIFTQTTAYARKLSATAEPAVPNALYNDTEKAYAAENSTDDSFPRLEGDVFIKSVSGRIKLNEDKSIKDIHFKAVISGKEKDGTVHDLEAELKAVITNINSTEIQAPDLEDKNVVYHENKFEEFTVSQAFVGKYKSDLVELKGGTFEKTGESYLEIKKIQDKKIDFLTYNLVDGVKQDEREITASIDGHNWASFYVTDPNTGEEFYGYMNFRNNGTISYFDGEKEETLYSKVYE